MERNAVDHYAHFSNSPLAFICIHRTGMLIALVAWAFCMAIVDTRPANGFPPPRFENGTEQVVGTIGRIAANQFTAGTEAGREIIIEAGGIRLFGLPEFGVDGIRISLAKPSFAISLSGAAVSSPVGSEHAAGISMHFDTASRITLGVRLDGALVSLDACERSAMLTTSSFVMTRLVQGMSVACAAEDLYLSGETLHGVDLSLSVVGRFHSNATAKVTFHIDRWGVLSMGYAASLRMGTRFNGLVGYEGASGQLKTAVALSSTSWTCEICVLIHPVLGLSKGIFLQWRR